MKLYATKIALVFSFLMLAGCATKTGTGALIGGGVGALGGAIIGNQMGGHNGTGAVIGGLGGALVGGGIGNAQDKRDARDAREAERNEWQTNSRY